MKEIHSKKGFTLAEVLVVVAIVAVLVAIAIPTYHAATKKAEAGACLANRTTLENRIKIAMLAEDNFDANAFFNNLGNRQGCVCPTGGAYVLELKDGEVHVLCAKHTNGNLYGMGDNIPEFDFAHALKDALEQVSSTSHIDSGSNGLRTQQVEAFFAQNGIDMEKSGIKTWMIYNKDGETYFYWTLTSMDDVSVGEQVTVMRYNLQKGTYTVGSMEVTPRYTDNDPNKPIMTDKVLNGSWSSKNETPGQSADTKNDFKEAYDFYQQTYAKNGK